MASTPRINDDAAELLAALGMSRRYSPEEANKLGYFSGEQWEVKTGASWDALRRRVAKCDKIESVPVKSPGNPKYYRLKRK